MNYILKKDLPFIKAGEIKTNQEWIKSILIEDCSQHPDWFTPSPDRLEEIIQEEEKNYGMITYNTYSGSQRGYDSSDARRLTKAVATKHTNATLSEIIEEINNRLEGSAGIITAISIIKTYKK